MLFKDERFGMFVHWGIYSVGGWHEQEQWRKGMPKEQYVSYADLFNPDGYSPDEWFSAAKNAGMEYVVFTTKHHDGFCMWDTKYTDYNIMNTPYGKDILKEVSESCKKFGLKLGLYYSITDWNHVNSVNFGGDHQLKKPNPGDMPDEEKYKEYIRNQMGELLTNYGKIDALFWDIPPYNKDESINKYVRSLAPDILINDRGYSKGDYSTPERSIPKNKSFTTLTEACQSVGRQSWGYRKNEDYLSHKLIEASIDSVMSKGGNYLLNVGPDAKGHLTKEAIETLSVVGDWYNRVSESYIGAQLVDIGLPTNINDVVVTKKDNALYFHLPPVAESSGLALKPIDVLPESAVVLNSGEELCCEMEYIPFYYHGTADNTPYLHIMGIPVNRLSGEVIVIKATFKDLDELLEKLKSDKSELIL